MQKTEFDSIRHLIKQTSGIDLGDDKMPLVKNRLGSRARELGLASVSEYVETILGPQGTAELPGLLDAITTNVTRFFRQPKHFTFLRNTLLPELAQRGDRKIRIWSAGCSTGEEPYSIAIQLAEGIPDLDAWDTKILATDLCRDALKTGRSGRYPKTQLDAIPANYRQRYFKSASNEETTPKLEVVKRLRNLIHFGSLNLMEPWPMRGPFDAIFCRNVMIYFDTPTKQKLVRRYMDLLRPNGILYLGESECLATAVAGLTEVGSSTYRKQ